MRNLKDESAQFMLLAGFIIGIGLVITTIMLNSIVFESNMAVGAGTDSVRSEVINLMQISMDETRRAYGNASTVSPAKSTQINNFNDQTRNFSRNLSKIYAFHGEGINISLDITNWNNGNKAYFTDNGTSNGLANWTVVENAVNRSNITINFSSPGGSLNIGFVNNTDTIWYNLTGNDTRNYSSTSQYSIVFNNGSMNQGNYSITGKTFNGKNFTRARDYVLYSTVLLSTSRARMNITIPVTVQW